MRTNTRKVSLALNSLALVVLLVVSLIVAAATFADAPDNPGGPGSWTVDIGDDTGSEIQTGIALYGWGRTESDHTGSGWGGIGPKGCRAVWSGDIPNGMPGCDDPWATVTYTYTQPVMPTAIELRVLDGSANPPYADDFTVFVDATEVYSYDGHGGSEAWVEHGPIDLTGMGMACDTTHTVKIHADSEEWDLWHIYGQLGVDWVTLTTAPTEVWVDDDYCDACANDGHTWGYDAFDNIQDGINAVACSTVNVAAGTYSGGIDVNKSVTLIALGEVIIGPGSHGVTVSTDDVTLDGFTYDGTGCSIGDDGIHVNDGIQNLWIRNCEVRNWCDNGVEFAGAITGLKIVDNYIHNNTDDGIEFNGTPAGTVQIYGNAFRSNGGDTGYGINMASGSVSATYNEWGHVGGPTSSPSSLDDPRDAASSGVTYTPWVFGKLYVDPASQNVRETEQATVYVKMDVHHLYGIQFTVTFSDTLLQLNADPTIGNFRTTGDGRLCTVTDAATANGDGTIHFKCNRADTDAEYDATDDPILTLVFDAQDIPGTDATSAIAIDPDSVVLGAKGGVNIFVDSVTDGEVKVLGTSTVSGVVDLQGRDDDSGAVVDPEAGTTYHSDPAAYTTAAWGTYSFSDMTDDEYTFTVEMPRYLGASKTVNVQGETLDLGTVILLGGDCNDDKTIDILDAIIIGTAFGSTTGGTGWDARADINDSGNVNILDAVLLGGNWQKSSPVAW